MIWLFFVIGLGKATEEHVNKLRGPWEVIPITGSLEENTEFLPIYIDDVMDEFDSTMDMLILQSGKNIEWISDIRGTSITTKSTVISNSLWTLVKVSYFDDDPFPDLLICTSDLRSVKLLRNKVRENLEILKKEQLNPEYFENNEKLEDWPSFELVTVEKTSTIIDFLVTDLNHDGIPDLILAVRHKDGTCSIKELIFSNTLTLQYSMQEIWFENTGIIELLGVYDLELSTYSILFLSGKGELSYMLNKDPVYSSEIMLKLGTTEKLSSFMSCDLNKDGKIDFLLVNNGELIWVYNEPTGWTSKTVYSDGVLQAILAKVTKNSISEVIVLYEDHVFWATEVPAKGSNEGFTWENNGETMVFHDFLIDLQETFQWSRFKIADLEKRSAVDLLLFSAPEGTIYWGRKKPANLKGLGWSPDFWIYIMIYVMLMSLAAGFFHSHFTEKIEDQSVILSTPAVNEPQQFEVLDSRKKKTNLRKTTF